mmetsp:Transcript_9624/g.19992  ORF Transcript_9624/g.19992 Transcript_9624/m.19992 type:complete len:310 (+) Transcript_9624:146-1075(+)
MGGKSLAKEHPWEYLGASALAATLNYPLWRASAVGQSGFVVSPVMIAGRSVPAPLAPYVYAFLPPYKGCVATVLGMTWARAAIFWGSDYGRTTLRQAGHNDTVSTVLPPLLVSTLVQCINMPLVRSTITLQNPQCEHNFRTVPQAMMHIYQTHGVAGLWHGTSAGILKTVPKYCTAIVIKDIMEDSLPPAHTPTEQLCRSALKSAAAGLAGAALTNPLDVIRNEMFKSNQSLPETIRYLYETEGWGFLSRGLVKNLVAVSIPVACTIFFTDALIQWNSPSSMPSQPMATSSTVVSKSINDDTFKSNQGQ